ncbi:MAG: hypothetical protein KAR17_02550 [Cyclobacteriaceae bacterium]|nr:hypothetical protein [Cyclobacteriaceae bacterium]
MSDNWKKLLFLNKSWPIRIWMWSAIISMIFYLVKFSIITNPIPTELDMIFMTYGLGSIAIYVLIFGFDWS